MDASKVRSSFTGFFADRGHAVVPSASLIPHDPTVLFTIAGMVPFKAYFLGDEKPPWPRATSVQRCFRTIDIELVGRTSRHCTFFEMLGNFSFGDYTKAQAIPYAWELLTETFGIDGDRLWVTVHESDTDAEEIWKSVTDVAHDRIQRLGEENLWGMGETGPCGPCSEIFYDNGPEFGADGGPATGGADRFVEIWDLVFMQSDRQADGTVVDLPRPSIDTGAGLERILPILQGKASIFDTDLFVPLVEKAREVAGVGSNRNEVDETALRVMADHGRAMAALVSDGVLPSNEGRGYVLRHIVRRAVLSARRLGSEQKVAAPLARTAAQVLQDAYPSMFSDIELTESVLEREEYAFDATLRSGLSILRDALDDPGVTSSKKLAGKVAFRLHDTHGFPIELTEEIAREEGVSVEREGFEEEMERQRSLARNAARVDVAASDEEYRAILESDGASEFVGYKVENYSVAIRVVAVLKGLKDGTVELFLDQTPFYAESGGQVGDNGVVTTETGKAVVFDTVTVFPGLISHRARIEGEVLAGQIGIATIDVERREAIRRNHTGTHLLHAALRDVLGSHVRQQGSLVAPERLRFDFSHHGPLSREELAAVVRKVNAEVITDEPVSTVETTRRDAEEMGALAFFGDKYGEAVRVVHAGSHSLEFCGGTHVDRLGQIGLVRVLSEGSIGSNTRRIEAVTGKAAVENMIEIDEAVYELEQTTRVDFSSMKSTVEKILERQRDVEKELSKHRRASINELVKELAKTASGGVVVQRRDGLSADELRSAAVGTLQAPDVVSVVLGGVGADRKVSIAVASKGQTDASEIAKIAAKHIGGGGGGSDKIALAGGRDADGLDRALLEAKKAIS